MQRYVPWSEGDFYTQDKVLELQQRLIDADYLRDRAGAARHRARARRHRADQGHARAGQAHDLHRRRFHRHRYRPRRARRRRAALGQQPRPQGARSRRSSPSASRPRTRPTRFRWPGRTTTASISASTIATRTPTRASRKHIRPRRDRFGDLERLDAHATASSSSPAISRSRTFRATRRCCIRRSRSRASARTIRYSCARAIR